MESNKTTVSNVKVEIRREVNEINERETDECYRMSFDTSCSCLWIKPLI